MSYIQMFPKLYVQITGTTCHVYKISSFNFCLLYKSHINFSTNGLNGQYCFRIVNQQR